MNRFNIITKTIILIAMLLSASAAQAQSAESNSYFSKGVSLYQAGRYTDAIPCFEKVEQLDKAELSPESNRADYGTIWLASCYFKLGDTDTARQLAPAYYMFEPVDRRLTVESDREFGLAIQAEQNEDFEEALRHAQKCLEIEIANLGEKNAYIAGTHNAIGLYNHQLGKYYQALISYNEGLLLLYENLFDNTPVHFNLIMGKVYAFLEINDIQSAYEEIAKLEDIAKHEKTENQDEYPYSLVYLLYTRTALQNNEYSLASIYATRAFEKLIELYNPADEEKFESLYSCYTSLAILNQFDEAKEFVKSALNTINERNGSDAHKGIMLACLADCENDIETYKQSLELLHDENYLHAYYSTKLKLGYAYEYNGMNDEALSIYKEIVDYYSVADTKALEYRKSLTAMGEMYAKLGLYNESNDAYVKALETYDGNKEDPSYLFTYMKWIPAYAHICPDSESATGFEFAQEILTLMSNYELKDFINYGLGINDISFMILSFYQTLFSYSNLLTYQNWNLSKLENDISQMISEYLIPMNTHDSQIVGYAKSMLAHVKFIMGKYEENRQLMAEAIEIYKNLDIPYLNLLHDLAYYQYDSGDTYSAYDNFLAGYQFNVDRILTNYRWMTVDERSTLTRAYRGNLDNIPRYAAATPGDSRYAGLGYNALLFTKGLLLNSTIELSRLIQEEGDGEALGLLAQWRGLNQQHHAALQQEDNAQASALKEKANEIEKQLIAKSKTFGDYTKGLTVEYPQVQAGLKANDVAIEFFSYQQDATSTAYGALLLTKDNPPRYVEMGSDTQWGTLVENCYNNSALFDNLFSNLRPHLPTSDQGDIYFAASGLLHNVAIENLPGAEPYRFKRLSSTRELAMNRQHTDSAKDMTIVGGVKYGLGDLAEYYNYDTPPVGDKRTDRGIPSLLPYLPGTKIEADAIASLMSEKLNVNTLSDENATKENLKKISGKRTSMLHIATHGFFSAPQTSENPGEYEADAMNSSGLYFAGAQNTLWDEPDKDMTDDGILTAHEISMLDLRGLKLSVLSACETGKGVMTPDGVFGLQRGFKQAGTEGIMMSLWKVDDTATQILMEEFYKNLTAGNNQYEALRNAQLTVKASYPDPKYWAAFILIDALGELNP